MAITDAQKVDYLYKKIGFGVAKTDTSAFKSPSNEANASPLLIRGDTVWAISNQIPALIPTSNSSVVVLYKDTLTSTIECTLDTTVSGTNRTWRTNLTDWIPPEFGSSYQVKVYAANSGLTNAQTAGTQLFSDGSGNNDSWYFDYQAGILNFADTNVPSALSVGKKVYISGARYIGQKGITNFSNGITIGNITINGNTITGNTDVTFGGNVTASNYITTGNVQATYFVGNAAYLTGLPTQYSNSNVAAYLLTNTGNISAGNVLADLRGNVYTNYINSVSNNIYITPAGNLVVMNSTGATVISTGGTATRPTDAIAGALRFNVDTSNPEYYTGSAWVPITPSQITSQVITPDGSSIAFTLDQTASTNGVIVSINGTLQQPGTAYVVTGTTLTFAEIPQITDIVEVRYISAAVVLEENTGVVSAANVSVGTSLIVVDSFDKTTYRSARYTVSATAANGDTQISEVYVVHNGSTASYSIGSNAYAGTANVATYSAAISGSTVQFKAQAANTGAVIRIQKLYFVI